jgi:hypothetical protein
MIRTLIAAALFVAASAHAQEGPKELAKKHAAFEKLKSLVGTWEAEKDMKATVVYRLTAGGSTLMETIAPGTDHEMVTMYSVDKGELILTHYCVMGNQPRMKAEKSDKADVIRFACTTGGGNMSCDTDGHMHSAVFTFADADTVTSVWTMRRGGKDDHSARFELKRKK